MRTALNIFIALLTLGTLLGFSPGEAHADSITVEVRSIVASTEGDAFDNRLDDLKTKLQKAFRGYKSFKQLGRRSLKFKEDKEKSMPLPNGSELTLTYHGMAGDLVKLGLSIAGKMSTTLRASPGSTFFQAGMDHDDGMLILAITVK